MLKINKPSQPLIPPTDVEGIEEIATSVASAAIASDTTHAPLVNELVPAENLPSYVDDVLNFPSLAQFPEVGEEGKIYVANDTNNTYRWSGLEYVQVGGSEIDLTPYAKKVEVNAALAEKADITYVDAEVVELEGAIAEKASSEDLAALATEVGAKANAAAVDEALALKANASDVYTKAQVDDALGMKANAIDVYTKAQVDNALAAKADAADVESALNEKQDSISDLDTIRSGAADGVVAKTTTNNLTNNSNCTSYYIKHISISALTNEEQQILFQIRQDFISGKHPRLYCISDQISGSSALSNACILSLNANRDLQILIPWITARGGTKAIAPAYSAWRVNGADIQAGDPQTIIPILSYNTDGFSAIQWDTTPTANSTKPVTSGGIKTALDAKADANSVYTKSEVDSAIAAAIGNVLDQSF